MTHDELDALLEGAAGATLTLSAPDGIKKVYFERQELRSPIAWRAALRRQMPVGYRPPVYSTEDHDQIVRALFALADAMKWEVGQRAA